MFLSKYFSRLSQAIGIKWPLILVELVIVFVGVYLAFLLNTYQENKYIKQESEKIWSSLKIELEGIRLAFPVWAENQAQQNQEWDSLFAINEIGDFYTWRYIQPQYDFTTIQYAIDSRESSIVDFNMYKQLTSLFQNIQQLEHAERLMTDVGLRYRNQHQQLPEGSNEYKIITAENRFLFYKFLDFSRIRVGGLRRLANSSEEILQKINEKLGPDRQLELEKEFIQQQLDKLEGDVPKKMALQKIKNNFPYIPEQVIEEIFDSYYAETAQRTK